MGSSSSKAARTASGAARKYPSRIPPTTAAPRTSNAPSQPPPPGDPSRPGPTVRPQARVSETRDEAINLDASDPAYAASLRSLGARKKLSASSTRWRDGEGAQGRQFLDVGLLRHVLMLRDEKGLSGEEIERRLGLKKGIVGRLGPKGVVESV
ncbi:hypothetical protein H2199_003803 [Coniosporium tulheliwenetii]|uniref:Uncharacterized protein n=1 Tax=Coniosporium tulheliwenetii TaxID=3383036 RepID=A0ACC2Z9M1_9PEZI|nr:hypothetical protein H2199_003803 [Cladosporium sp. JES 115]